MYSKPVKIPKKKLMENPRAATEIQRGMLTGNFLFSRSRVYVRIRRIDVTSDKNAKMEMVTVGEKKKKKVSK